jgi:hypothetical protein
MLFLVVAVVVVVTVDVDVVVWYFIFTGVKSLVCCVHRGSSSSAEGGD